MYVSSAFFPILPSRPAAQLSGNSLYQLLCLQYRTAQGIPLERALLCFNGASHLLVYRFKAGKNGPINFNSSRHPVTFVTCNWDWRCSLLYLFSASQARVWQGGCETDTGVRSVAGPGDYEVPAYGRSWEVAGGCLKQKDISQCVTANRVLAATQAKGPPIQCARWCD